MNRERRYVPQGAVRDYWRCSDRVVVCYGPVRSGKSAGICEKDQRIALREPGARILWLRRYRRSLNETILQLFDDHLAAWGEIANPNPSRGVRDAYRFRNGSEIILGGLDNAERIMGAEYDRISIFEATEVAFDSFAGHRGVITRMSGKGTAYPQLTLDCNPQGPQHWIHQEIVKDQATPFLIDHKANPRWWDAKAGEWTQDGIAYIEGVLGRLDGVARARLVEGRWVASDGVVYDLFSRDTHVCVKDPAEAERVVVCVDDGTTDPFAAYRLEIDHDGRVHVAREVYQSGMSSPEKIKAVRDLGGEEGRIVYDSAAAGLGRDLRDHFREVVPSNKARWRIVDGIARVRDRMRPADDGRPRLTVDPSCVNLLREFDVYEWKRRQDGSDRDEPRDHMNHGCDSVRYGICDIDDERGVAFGIIGDGDGEPDIDEERFWS